MIQWPSLMLTGVAVLIVVVVGYLLYRCSKPQTSPFDPPSTDVPAELDEALSQVVWLEHDDNPFKMRVLDCRSVCDGLQSWFPDFSYLGRLLKFDENRKSNGKQHCGKRPHNCLHANTQISYPPKKGGFKDGAVFVAPTVYDKWNIFLHDGQLYMADSWSDELRFRATIKTTETEVVVTDIDADTEITGDDPKMAVRVVDFLIKSNLYEFECPHPVPPSMANEDIETITLWSSHSFGRRGHFATFEDTTSVRIT